MSAGDPVKAVDLTALAVSSSTRPIVRLIQQVAQSIATTNTALTFTSGSEDIDTHGFHDVTTNPSRITPTIAGYYELSGTYATAATAAAFQALTVGKNGTVVMPRSEVHQDPVSSIRTISVGPVPLTADGVTDYFELFALTSGGPTLSQVTGGYASVFHCVYLRPL